MVVFVVLHCFYLWGMDRNISKIFHTWVSVTTCRPQAGVSLSPAVLLPKPQERTDALHRSGSTDILFVQMCKL